MSKDDSIPRGRPPMLSARAWLLLAALGAVLAALVLAAPVDALAVIR